MGDYGAVDESDPTNPLIEEENSGGNEGGEEEGLVKPSTKDRCFKPKTAFFDHFSLQAPSDVVRFRSTAVRIYQNGNEQFQLEESPTKIRAKLVPDGSSGLSIIRSAYTLVAILMTGFLLIFSLQVLLFLFMSLVVEGGLTSKQSLNSMHVIGTILSVPIFVYGLASALTMASEFVSDTWNGHYFFRTIMRLDSIIIEWIAFFVFFGIPLATCVFNLFIGNDDWWEVTALRWFRCVLLTFFFFCLCVFFFEVRGALELLNHHPDYDETNVSFHKLLGRAIQLRQVHRYSGNRTRTFLIEGGHELPSINDSYDTSEDVDHDFKRESVNLYTEFTRRLPDSLWMELPKPIRQFDVDDVLDRVPFITSSTWNLEKLYFRRRDARAVVVVNGESALTDKQVASTMACAILGNFIAMFFLISLLLWIDVPTKGIIFLVILSLFCFFPALKKTYALFETYRDTRESRQTNSSTSEALYEVTEIFRVTQPSAIFCWILFVLEIVLFFVCPLISLYNVGNKLIGDLFFILGVFSGFRHFFNAPLILGELGSLDLLNGDFLRSSNSGIEKKEFLSEEEKRIQDREDWRDKNRMSSIIGKITQGRRRDGWLYVFSGFVLMFFFLFLLAYTQGSNKGANLKPHFAPGFEYVPVPESLAFPTCSMRSGFEIPNSPSTALADYTFLAAIAYVEPDRMSDWLDGWFGEGVAYDNTDIVNTFRTTHKNDKESAVHYKLIEFPNLDPDFAVMTIRGTSNGWDMLTDAQLWSAALLAQMVRALLPLGEIWTPILEDLVRTIAILQHSSLKKVAFYQQTTAFVKWLQTNNRYPTLRITGHSLGGGLAMISGAQTHTPAIGLSGPNSMISRDTYEPPISIEELNTHTFNIIPDRDPVPMIDDPAQNYQSIHCIAPKNAPADCHNSLRSLCDILVTCGSGSRMVLCECSRYFGYPEPTPTSDNNDDDDGNGAVTFDEVCPPISD